MFFCENIVSQLFFFSTRQSLYLSFNRLESLPAIPFGLTLTSLFASDNGIREWPEKLNDHLPCLVWLDLSRNALKSLGDVTKLKNLRQLYVSENDLRCLPHDMFKLTSLHHLDLNCNFALPSSFAVETAGLDEVQVQLSEISAFFLRMEAARDAIYETILIHRQKRVEWQMPVEILNIVLHFVWVSRYDSCWDPDEENENERELEAFNESDEGGAWAD